MQVKRERVHTERVGEEVHALAMAADAVGSPEPERVVQVTVDALGVVAAAVQTIEVGIAGWDGAQVLGPVELTSRVVSVTVQADRDGSAVVLLR